MASPGNILNPGFETSGVALTNWVDTNANVGLDSGNKHSGARSAQLSVNSSGGVDSSLHQDVAIDSGATNIVLTYYRKIVIVDSGDTGTDSHAFMYIRNTVGSPGTILETFDLGTIQSDANMNTQRSHTLSNSRAGSTIRMNPFLQFNGGAFSGDTFNVDDFELTWTDAGGTRRRVNIT